MVDLVRHAFDYETGAYMGPVLLNASDADPRSPGILLCPGNCVSVAPPRCGSGLWPFWINGEWVVMQEIEKPGELFFSEFDN